MAEHLSILPLPSSVTLDSLSSKLEKVSGYSFQGAPGIKAACPAHDDKTPSLSAWVGAKGNVLVKCWSGCPASVVKERLEALGVQVREEHKATVAAPAKVIVARYPYYSPDGELIAEKIRYEPKTFSINWITTDKQNNYPYGWPYGIDLPDGPLIWNEGEKGADACIKAGARGFATLKKGALPASLIEALRNANDPVLIVQDNDDPGREYASAAYQQMVIAGIDCRIVSPACTHASADAFDHFEQGFGVEDFLVLPDEHLAEVLSEVGDELKQYEIPSFIIKLDAIKESNQDFIWFPYLPALNITMIQGAGESGKSYFCHALLSMLSRGELPGHGACLDPISSLILSGEDDAATVTKPRMQGCKADFSKISQIEIDSGFSFNSDADVASLTKYVIDSGIGLLVADPFSSFSGVEDFGNPASTRNAMVKFLTIAKKANASAIMVVHENRAGSFLGSVELRNVSKSQLVLGNNRALHVKSNYAARGAPITFHILDNGASINGYHAGTNTLLPGLSYGHNEPEEDFEAPVQPYYLDFD